MNTNDFETAAARLRARSSPGRFGIVNVLTPQRGVVLRANAAWFVFTVLLAPVVGEVAGGAKPVKTVLVDQSEPSFVVTKAREVFMRHVSERSGAQVVSTGRAELTVALSVDPGVGPEGFAITGGTNGSVRIVGNDVRGLYYGVGAYLRTCRYAPSGFIGSPWRGTSAPAMSVRGIYFATHFHNFYHDAPVEEVQHYVEDLALWGINTLIAWYDMHHFNGWDDPAAAIFRGRLRAVLQCARSVGLDVGLVVIANEGYANSPVELRADASAMRGEKNRTDICISNPAGQKYVLANFAQLFDWAKDLQPGFVWVWPYDSGGCGCSQCKPWGNNGFLRAGERVAGLAKEKFPGAKVAVSTWFFDRSEWQGLATAFAPKPGWPDYLISQPNTPAFTKSSPGGLPVLGFPEISMRGMRPWGGFGANPQPHELQRYWNAVKSGSSGGFPYSEGIFEDINKIICAQFYWRPDRSVDEILREYISFEYSPEVVEDLMKVITILEQNHHVRAWSEQAGVFKDVPLQKGTPTDPGAEDAYATAKKVEARLSPYAQKSWRWRILFLRALLDAELKRNGGKPNPLCEQAFQELTRIYYAQHADPHVKPPAPTKISANHGAGIN